MLIFLTATFMEQGLMRHINYNHLLYFWTVTNEGSVVAAAEKLNLTPQTISGQLKLLEDMIGEPLFERSGRGLKITPTGKMIAQYADEIFSLGAELTQRIKSKALGSMSTLNIGIVNSIPKLISYRILQPVLELDKPFKLSCSESGLEHLLADLAVHKLDLVLSDRPIPTGLNVKAFNHSLGTSTLAFFGHPALIKQQKKQSGYNKFPELLNHAPLIMPLHTNALRRHLDDWFDQQQLQPNIIAEFDDSALLKAFGQAAAGFFAAPTVIAREIEDMYSVKKIGEIKSVNEHYYIISPERYLKHPAVIEITQNAKFQLA
jgi:LysR family transcriptional activator of nhaA